jgi:nitrite reductase (NADH) small subunit
MRPEAHDYKKVTVAREAKIPEGAQDRAVDGLSIGVFHHHDGTRCATTAHRGGPVYRSLVGDTLTCPWHGFQYNVANGCW